MSAFETTPRKSLSQQQKAKLFLERNGCCRECGRTLRPGDQWIVEHIIALQNGGTNEWDNLGITCSWCVPKKNAADAKQAAKSRSVATKHLVPKSERPSKWPKPPPGYKHNWNTGRLEKSNADD